MATIQQQLTQLQQDKQDLVNNLTEKGITATSEETFTELVPKVLDIETGGGDISEYFETIVTAENFEKFGNNHFIKKVPTVTIADGVTNISYLFSESKFLKEINIENTKNVKFMERMFYECANLAKVNLFDTSNVTVMNYMFFHCINILEIPKFNTSSVYYANQAFSNCSKLVKIPQLDFGGCGSISNACAYCPELAIVDGFLNIGKAFGTSASENVSTYEVSFSGSPKLTLESVNNIIDNLYDIASKGVKPQRLRFHSTVLSQIPEEKIAVATQKGWTVST